MAAIVVNGLERAYGSVRAVDGLSFTVGDGEVFDTGPIDDDPGGSGDPAGS